MVPISLSHLLNPLRKVTHLFIIPERTCDEIMDDGNAILNTLWFCDFRILDFIMSRRTLEFVLQKLCHANFLKNGSKDSYYFAKHGLKMHEKFVNCLTHGRSDLLHVESEEEADDVLNKGFSAVQIPHQTSTNAFVDGTIFEDPKCKIRHWNLVKIDKSSSSMPYQGYLRSRRQFWKELMFNPSQIVMSESSAHDNAIIKMQLEDLDVPIPQVELESIEISPKTIKDDWRVFHSVVAPNVGIMAILLDSLRIRNFDKSPRIALKSKIAPVVLGIMINSTEKDVVGLSRYVELLLLKENIEVLVGSDLQTFDDLGVPYVLVVDKTSLNNGVIKIRDRESTWHEQIHLAHVVPRMVKLYQDRNVTDTLTSVKQKYGL